MIRRRFLAWFKVWSEKHLCDQTTLEIQPVQYDGMEPVVAVRVIHVCDEIKLGEVRLSPGVLDDLIGTLTEARDRAADAATFRRLMK
jgi:hypothetical protein